MKILNVIYNKGQGGLEDMYLKYSEILTKTGNEVICMLPYNSMTEEKARDLDVRVVLNRDISSSISYVNPLSVYRMKRIIKDIQPDIIIIHNSRPLKLLNKAAKNICPVVVVHHGGSTKRLIDSAEHIICVSKHIYKRLSETGLESIQIHYIPNAVDIDSKYIKKPSNKNAEPLTIGVMARFTPEKGVDIFIEALKHMDIPYKALIAGDGDMKEELEVAVVKDSLNVEFLGWISDEDKESFFKRCDVIVVPSRSEHFGLVVLEAWMHSVPVISSKTNGGMELIDNRENGFLFDLEDSKDLAEVIVGAASSSDELTRNAYGKLTNNYSTTEIQKKLTKTLDDIINFEYKTHENKIKQKS